MACASLRLTTEGGTKFKPKGWKCYPKKLQCNSICFINWRVSCQCYFFRVVIMEHWFDTASGNSMDASQEMIALALCNLIGSTVSSMPTCGAFTRSAVSNASGVRTPMVGLYTGLIVLLALSFLTPFFYFIPRSTLAAVLICAVMFLIDFQIVGKLWRTSSKLASVWAATAPPGGFSNDSLVSERDLVTLVATFTACLLVGVEVGLVVGMALDMTRLLHVWARPGLNITIVCVSITNTTWACLICSRCLLLKNPRVARRN